MVEGVREAVLLRLCVGVVDDVDGVVVDDVVVGVVVVDGVVVIAVLLLMAF